MDFTKCMTKAEDEKECVSWWDDYKECLRSKKMRARFHSITEEWKEKSKEGKAPDMNDWFKDAQKKFG